MPTRVPSSRVTALRFGVACDADGVILDAVKPADYGEGVVIWMYEARGVARQSCAIRKKNLFVRSSKPTCSNEGSLKFRMMGVRRG